MLPLAVSFSLWLGLYPERRGERKGGKVLNISTMTTSPLHRATGTLTARGDFVWNLSFETCDADCMYNDCVCLHESH